MIVLQSPLLCEGRGGHPLCLSGDSSVLMDLHCCMPNPVEGLLEVYEDMVEVLLVLEMFLTEVS